MSHPLTPFVSQVLDKIESTSDNLELVWYLGTHSFRQSILAQTKNWVHQVSHPLVYTVKDEILDYNNNPEVVKKILELIRDEIMKRKERERMKKLREKSKR